MTIELATTGFGAISQALRIRYGKRILDQADALGVSPSHVTKVETGKIQPDQGYVDRLSSWLKLDLPERLALIKGLRRASVVDFAIERQRRKGPAIKLYRTIHTLSPSEIRSVPTLTEVQGE